MAANRRYTEQKPRAMRTPPHVSLRALRNANGKKLDEVCALVNEHLGDPKPFTRGALSAIENGIRGASTRVLEALEVAYGLAPGDITTEYKPREREAAA